ncbi:hypothetical protein YC2023_080642 [Brassica napus]
MVAMFSIPKIGCLLQSVVKDQFSDKFVVVHGSHHHKKPKDEKSYYSHSIIYIYTIGERKLRKKVDYRSGDRPARERAYHHRSPLFLRVSYRSWIFSLFSRVSALSELWSAFNSGVSVSWREDAVVGVEGTVK